MESLIKSVGENDYQPEKCMYLQSSTFTVLKYIYKDIFQWL